MGCVNSKTDINDRHPNIFQVINVNDQRRPISPGKLEVTEIELVFYQKGKQPTRWPLRSLRKYGFDFDVFSFECGRRCPTGQGIYAFRCRKAEQLFNIVQQYITGNVNEDNPLNNAQNNIEFPIPAVSTGPPVQRRISTAIPPEGYLNPIQPIVRPVHPAGVSRPGSISSNGQLSPTAISPPPVTTDLPLEHNNNKRNSLVPDHSYTNTSVLAEGGPEVANYENLGIGNVQPIPEEPLSESSCHVYMNVDPTKVPTKETMTNTKELTDKSELSPVDVEEIHCYANIDAKEIENLRPISDSYNSVPSTPTVYTEVDYVTEYITVREVNYAELDLDNTNARVSIKSPPAVLPESPTIKKKPYATIDFPKTFALSQSINPRMEIEEGSRKTRHNSTINSFGD